MLLLQANLVKQLGKLVKVRYVEDITSAKRVGEWHQGGTKEAPHSAIPTLLSCQSQAGLMASTVQPYKPTTPADSRLYTWHYHEASMSERV